MDLELAGDTALVAASSAGLGRAAAAAFAAEGANVVVNGRDAERVEAAVDRLGEAGAGRVLGVPGDVSDPMEAEALVEATVDRFGTVDHLVTNAGGPPGGSFLETTDEDWQSAYELLLGSVVVLCRSAADALREDGGGTITAIASKAVKEPADRLVLSNAVRAGVVGLMKTLSREWAPSVRANVVLPGSHATERVESLVGAGIERGEYESVADGLAHWRADIPEDRLGDPDRFGQVVAFLASAPASFVNGAALVVDGGAARSIL